MRKSIFGVMAVVMALALSTMAVAIASSTMLEPFTQEELDTNWEADRQFPSGGVTSVSAHGRDDVAAIGVVGADRSTEGEFYYFEGITKVDDFGLAVQVDLYVPAEWENAETSPLNVGFWANDDPSSAYPVIAFRNGEAVVAGFYTFDGSDWAATDINVNYDAWNTLSITLDPDTGIVNYDVNGQDAGTLAASGDSLGQVFLNHYNDGVNDFTAHWHAGAEEPENGDITIVFVKSWTGAAFEGSDDVAVTFTVDIDGDEVTLDDGETSDPFDAEGDWDLTSETVTGFPDDVCSYTMTVGSTTVDNDGHLLTAVTNEVECDEPEETPTETPEPEEEEIREITPAEAVEARPDFTG